MLHSQGNYISVEQGFGQEALLRMLATLHNLTTKKQYEEITVDFSACDAAFAGPMLAVCSQMLWLRQKGITTHLILPEAPKIARLFHNTNWAHLIDPERFAASDYRGRDHVAAIRFTQAREQQEAVTRLVDTILETTTDLVRGDLAAIEWALNEITDNVLTHAESAIGGIVQLSRLGRKKLLEIAVVDHGLSVPQTLRSGHRKHLEDTDVLLSSVQEGVTRDTALGQGNGLFGTYELARFSGGFLNIYSRYASLRLDESVVSARPETVPFPGTLLVAGLRYSDPTTLAKALRFQGSHHEPSDSLELRYELGDENTIHFRVIDEVASFRSRPSAEPLRTRIENLRRMVPHNRIVLDFEGISLISSSFADELIGKLFIRLGPTDFMGAIVIQGASPINRNLIDRAILQRSAALFPANHNR
jgi:anti-sigma regulatory factor (Ser/Thr protein kinase)